MAWTDPDTVKKHLPDLQRRPDRLRDVPVRLDDYGTAELPARGIIENSERVKIPAAGTPVRESPLVLTGEVWKSLTYDQLLPQSLTLAADDTLQTLYQLDRDFAVDWAGGRLRRLPGSTIPDGGTVAAYYARYQIAVRGADYAIDYAAGTLSALPGGILHPGTTVYLDCELSAAGDVDALVETALAEAEDLILARLKPEYGPESTDPGLRTGAGALTLAILCRALAARALADGAASAEGRARGWRELADAYDDFARRALMPFLAPPALPSAARKGNTSWWDNP